MPLATLMMPPCLWDPGLIPEFNAEAPAQPEDGDGNGVDMPPASQRGRVWSRRKGHRKLAEGEKLVLHSQNCTALTSHYDDAGRTPAHVIALQEMRHARDMEDSIKAACKNLKLKSEFSQAGVPRNNAVIERAISGTLEGARAWLR